MFKVAYSVMCSHLEMTLCSRCCSLVILIHVIARTLSQSRATVLGLRLRQCGDATSGCFTVGSHRIRLDDDFHWLVVVVLPAEAFTVAAATNQRTWATWD